LPGIVGVAYNADRYGLTMRGWGRVRLTVCAMAAVVAAATSAIGASAQRVTPEVRASQVSTDVNVQAGEAWAVTDPKDPMTVAVTWLGTRDSTDPARFLTDGYCGVAISHDGGRTWSRARLPFKDTTDPPSAGTHHVAICGDPVAAISRRGEIHVAAAMLGSPQFTQGLTSFDHGRTWTGPVQVFGVQHTLAGLQAHPEHRTPSISMGRGFMAVDPNTGRLSMHSQEDGGAEGRFLAVSDDGGRSWSEPRPIDPEIQSRSAGAHSAAHGVIALVYRVDPTSPFYRTSPSPAVRCDTACTVFATTRNAGRTWTRKVMKELPDSGFTLFGGGIVAADPAPDGAGRFAVLFTNGNGLDVWRTSDAGSHWRKSATLRGGVGAPTKPWIAFGPNGDLGVVWRTTDQGGRVDVWAALARAGRTSFSRLQLAKGVAAPTSVGPGDDCACNLSMDATTLAATWSGADASGQRQIFFGRVAYGRF
jgi:hypothetical protein